MIYGLYLSATGVLTSSYRQDVIANNLANSETVGFKKDLALFQQRRTAVQEMGLSPSASNKILEDLGGGTLAAPTAVDTAQGDLEPSDSHLDVAIEGNGFFMVNDNGKVRLTRNGHFQLDRAGQLVVANSGGEQVLNPDGKPIVLDPNYLQEQTAIGQHGEITQGARLVARLGVVDVPDREKLTKAGGTLMNYPDMKNLMPASGAVLREKFVERSNVDPAMELVQLMDAQRQLEANANMIRCQDQTLTRLVNDVAKLS